ncbi:MAG: hypothetical protein NZM25_09340 [Leptospiraceae bacterium]|nr:hypothetical protein [Leptospiraceae bacterium]MDW8307343.1 hypothetical protein [Leptospiraceae bacterium]
MYPKLIWLISFLVIQIYAQPTKREKAISQYKELIISMTKAAQELNRSLESASTAKIAASAMDRFTEKMTNYQVRLAQLDEENPELEAEVTPVELSQSLIELENSMRKLAETMAHAGERFGTDVSFQEAATRMAQSLSGENEEDYYEE